MKLVADGVFYHQETPEQAAEAVNTAQTTNPEIQGWAMIGGWPLFTQERAEVGRRAGQGRRRSTPCRRSLPT